MITCPYCSTPIPDGTPAGLCPTCLFKRGLEGNTLAGPWQPPSIDELAPFFPELDLLNFLGRGGMGAVYKARQKSLDRIVALKILPPEISRDPAFAQRFTREAQAMARLHHPNIVTLFEFGERKPPADGTGLTAASLFYFLMEFVDGMSLRQLINTGTITAGDALAIVPQICDALQYAHDRGIVHRDIKPENILLARGGQIKIADFGVAKLQQQGGEIASAVCAAHANTTTLAGTPAYMAPEQSAAPGQADNRADIYSLGVVFYQLLTGEMPKSGQFVPPSRKVAIDIRVDEIVLKALERSPTMRYQQVSEVKADVVTMLQTVATRPSMPVAALEDLRDQPKRRQRMSNKSVFAIVGSVAIILFAVLGIVAFMSQGKNDTAAAAPPETTPAAVVTSSPAPVAVPQVTVTKPATVPAVAASEPAKKSTLAAELEDFTSTLWHKMDNGLTTDITKDEIRIHGVSQFADWAHGNGIAAATPIPDGDFTLSVDIKIAKYDGDTEFKNPYIRVEARNRSAIGIFANPAFFYRLHDWKNPQTMSSTHKMFGDEKTAYHRMQLKWEDASGTATATVDGEKIGSIHTDLGPQRKISLFANTTTKGIDIDVYFKNLKVEIPASPDAEIP